MTEDEITQAVRAGAVHMLRTEVERLRAALGEIAGNKTNSRAWLEDRARRALEPKP